MACKLYFSQKKIPDEEQVEKIAWSIQDPWVQNWYITHQRRIDEMDFLTYMEELQRVWLPTDWERTIHARVLATSQGDRNFWDWAVELQSTNTLLFSTASHLNEDAMRNQLEASRNTELTEMCRNDMIDEILDYHTWMEAI